jgi:hypothetical protein
MDKYLSIKMGIIIRILIIYKNIKSIENNRIEIIINK